MWVTMCPNAIASFATYMVMHVATTRNAARAAIQRVVVRVMSSSSCRAPYGNKVRAHDRRNRW